MPSSEWAGSLCPWPVVHTDLCAVVQGRETPEITALTQQEGRHFPSKRGGWAHPQQKVLNSAEVGGGSAFQDLGCDEHTLGKRRMGVSEDPAHHLIGQQGQAEALM